MVWIATVWIDWIDRDRALGGSMQAQWRGAAAPGVGLLVVGQNVADPGDSPTHLTERQRAPFDLRPPLRSCSAAMPSVSPAYVLIHLGSH